MNSPLPAPREVKKPIPTPRRFVNKTNDEEHESKVVPSSPEEHSNTANITNSSYNSNTFSRRVSNASKQIADDIGQMVHDRKKAVIEGTRQSVRRIRRRFSSSSQDRQNVEQKKRNDYEDTLDMFNNIKFESPLSRGNSIYNNVENDSEPINIYNNVSRDSDTFSISSDESLNLPPPSHPPPPLPDEAVYDKPLSVASSNNSEHSNKQTKSGDYESVFPPYPYNSDSESSVDVMETTVGGNVNVSRSCSWKFYDPVQINNNIDRDENIYNNIEAEPESDRNFQETDPESRTSIRSCSGSSFEVRNSIYENHVITAQTVNESLISRPSQSVIFQFDPLRNQPDECEGSSVGHAADMRLLEELLQGDLYGTISDAHTLDEWSLSNESETEEFVNPPTPPLRSDSLPEDEQIVSDKSSPKSRSNWFTSTDAKPASQEQKKHSWFKQVKEVLEKAPDVVRGVRNKDSNVVERPVLGAKKSIHKKGMLYKVQSGPVEDLFGEYSGRWCILENCNFCCYSDNTCVHLKEYFRAQNILSIQILQDVKYKYRYDNDDLHCFELNTTGKSRGGHIYGSRNISECRIWMQLLAESLASRFKSKLTSNFIRMGWAYVREGVSGKWVGAWIILSERELHYAIDGRSVKMMDLRKARCIVLQTYQDTENNPKTNDRGPNMLVDCPDLVLYLRMWTARETKVWCHIVKLEAHNNRANLDQQQLTKNDVPVVVEKCINFIYAHGSMSEGIYRRAGTGSSISELLAKFRKDAFAVQLTTDMCNEHEVATALKRFFRDLPEPLLGCDHRQYLYEVSKHNNKEERIRMFKAALDQLPSVSYKTARKLLGHLHFISTQSAKNLMTVENLASIWGPTLMHYEDKDSRSNIGKGHQQDAEVIAQLIHLYRFIFPEDPGELEKEKLMLKVLQRHFQSPQGAVNKKTAGDFRVWIFLHNKEGKSYNVSIGPKKTAYEVCLELSEKIKLPVHELVLEEIVLGDRLIRPIHHTEKVLDVVLKWSYWDETDRKDNYLTVAWLSKYWEYIIEKPLPVSGELRFADNKTKLIKLYTFQFSQGTLTYFKDKTGEIVLHSWRIEDIVWYLGHETKRNPQSRWTVTFMELKLKQNRTRSCPYFGNILIWPDAASRANWLSAMLKARYPNDLAPPPKLLSI